MRPRKGTKTICPFSYHNNHLIYKDETPEGDENQSSFHIRGDIMIYKDETTEGDENCSLRLFFCNSRSEFIKMRPRKGTKTITAHHIQDISFIYKDEAPEGDENRQAEHIGNENIDHL